MSATTTPTQNSSARFYSSPEESAFTADIKIQIQEDRARDIKELEDRKNSEIQVSQSVSQSVSPQDKDTHVFYIISRILFVKIYMIKQMMCFLT
jgi:hypothetical protein